MNIKILKCEMSYKTLYNISWKDTCNWISSVRSGKYVAYCKACKKSFRINRGGI